VKPVGSTPTGPIEGPDSGPIAAPDPAALPAPDVPPDPALPAPDVPPDPALPAPDVPPDPALPAPDVPPDPALPAPDAAAAPAGPPPAAVPVPVPPRHDADTPGAVRLAPGDEPLYPDHWEADAVLRDGSTCHLRPIGPQDADRLRAFHRSLSSETIYYRFFAPYPELTARDVQRFTEVDHDSRVALVAVVGDGIIGVGRYDRTSDSEAEVAFTVRDDYQGRGLGSVLLEHLAAAARERGIDRFVAEVLPGNRKMLGTFAAAGYKVAQELDEGVVRLAFDIEPISSVRAVARSREQRAEARSVERLFRPATVAVVGASRRKDSLGNQLLRSMQEGGYTGRLFAIHPTAPEVAGVPAYRSLADAPEPVDLAIISVPADAVERVIEDGARAGTHGIVVISAGFAEAGSAGVQRQRDLVRAVRGAGMRLVGPNALGVVNTDSRVRLVAALSKAAPYRGRIAVFCQSAAIGGVLLDRFHARRLGMSSFISVGNRGDVSAPDALHYWSDDPATGVVALYLDGITNPRKAIRVAREVGRVKPVVALRTGRASQTYPTGRVMRRTTLPPHGVDQLFEQAGVVEVDSLDRLLDVSGLLACQPLPTGPRVAVISDSLELAATSLDTARGVGLRLAGEPVVITDVGAQLAPALQQAGQGGGTDAVVVVHVPPGVEGPADIAPVLRRASLDSTVPIVAVLSEAEHRRLVLVPDADGGAGRGSVPVFGTIEDAFAALGLAQQYSAWRRAPRGEVPALADVDTEGARGIAEQGLARQRAKPRSEQQTVRLAAPAVAALLACYGISVWPSLPVASEDEAVAQADAVGWPVVLKTVDPRLSRRMEMGGVRLNLESEPQLRAAYLSMSAQLDATSMAQAVVQRMAPPGVPCVLSSVEDPLYGPVVSFSLGGLLPELLQDRAYRVPPISDLDAHTLVRAPKASKLLFGYGGNPAVDVALVEDLLMRLGRMADDLPSLVRANLDPVVVSPRTAAVLGASIWLRVPDLRVDTEARRLAEV
jgi:acyl-CoA synthetase (NDP forming)/GNAT superfamily N-acetyltransferase